MKRGGFRARLIRVMLLAAVGYIFFIFHGLSSHLNPWSQALINAAVKYIYPKNGQDEITVLLFREENLADLNTHYPVPYSLHADVLEALASYEPEAVFIDFAFVDKRDDKGLKALSEALCALGNTPIPGDYPGSQKRTRVYLAAPVLANGQLSIKQEFFNACADRITLVTPEMDEKSGESGVLTYFQGRQWRDTANEAPGYFIPSPAFAMAETKLGASNAETGKQEIVWGKGVAPLNLKWMDCAPPGAMELISRILRETPGSARLNCPYHRTLSVKHLLNSAGDDDIEQALKGRTIFYGAGFRFTGDRVESPVYGEMPGVYLHAMAYDNLTSLGHDYKRADRNGMVKIIDSFLLLAAAALLVIFPPKEHSESANLIEFNRRALFLLLGAGFALSVLWWLVNRFGLDEACLAGAFFYLVYRIALKHDWGFAWLVGMTLGTSLYAYFVLDLGPRNILAFLAFFEIVEKCQAYLLKKAKTYEDLRLHFGNPRRPAKKTMPGQRYHLQWARWVVLSSINHALRAFFWIFQPKATKPETTP